MFLTSRFPPTISYGATGGPGFSTDVVILNSGRELRNSNWDIPLAEYDASHGVKNQSQLDELIAFFRIAQGRANGFRYKDWSDYQATVSQGVLTNLTPTTWQMYKRYTFDAYTANRLISKPITGTITIAGGGTYTIAYETGIITKTAGVNPTSWSGEFDVPCRFDIDKMKASVDSFERYSWSSIPIVEIRPE